MLVIRHQIPTRDEAAAKVSREVDTRQKHVTIRVCLCVDTAPAPAACSVPVPVPVPVPLPVPVCLRERARAGVRTRRWQPIGWSAGDMVCVWCAYGVRRRRQQPLLRKRLRASFRAHTLPLSLHSFPNL